MSGEGLLILVRDTINNVNQEETKAAGLRKQTITLGSQRENSAKVVWHSYRVSQVCYLDDKCCRYEHGEAKPVERTAQCASMHGEASLLGTIQSR